MPHLQQQCLSGLQSQPAASWLIGETFGKSFGMRGPDTNRSISAHERKKPATLG